MPLLMFKNNAMLEKKIDLGHKLAECVQYCNYCLNSCLEEQDVKMMVNCIRLDRDCALICSTTLQLVYKQGHFSKDILELCVKACKACAAECKKHNNEHCRMCAEKCEECAKTCHEFLGMIK